MTGKQHTINTRIFNDKTFSWWTDPVHFNVGDQVEYNTDHDDDEEAVHAHIGHIVQFGKQLKQISIKLTENDQICTYFIDEISIIDNKCNGYNRIISFNLI
eukprot:46928_1